jgi:hypothetical protein
MIRSVTYHADAARSAAETGRAPGGTWHKAYEVNLPASAKPAGWPGSPPSWWVWGWGGQQWAPAAVRGAPLYLGGWTFTTGSHAGQTKDVIIVAASDNGVYAYADGTAAATQIWSTSLGTAMTRATSNIDAPVGITSTPVLDPDNARMFVVAMIDDGTGVGHFEISCLDLDSGSVIQTATLSDPGGPGRPTFNGDVQDQRGALNLVGGLVFATFAAYHAYDAGEYHGWLVGCDANNLLRQSFLPTTRTVFGGGSWGPGGAALGADGALYVATGNPTGVPANYWTTNPDPGVIGDFADAVVKVQVGGTPGATTLTVVDWFFPADLEYEAAHDLDLGCSSVLPLPNIGGRNMAVICGKEGVVFLLDRDNLGHVGGQLSPPNPPPAIFSDESKTAPAYFHTSTGDYVYVSASGAPGLIAFQVTGTSLTPVWTAMVGGSELGLGDGAGAPVLGVNPNNTDQALVWIADCDAQGTDGRLYAFDAISGMLVFDSGTSGADAPGAMPHFPGTTCVGSTVLQGTWYGFACYRNAIRKRPKELKPEKWEHKDKLEKWESKAEKFEHKEIWEVGEKQQFEVPKLKDAEGYNPNDPIVDPWELLQALAARVDDIESRLAEGRAFIRPEERPDVGAPPVEDIAEDD